jgi:hypothetical protein
MSLKLAVAVLALSSFAVAQHGGGGGRPAGAGAGMGAGSSMGSSMGSSHGTGMSGDRGNSGQPGSMGSGMGAKTPTDILNQNTKLSGNLEKLLPQGMTAQQACAGFKNLGQCVAAIHVSHNLDIPFADLKAKVTGSGSESLGKAIGDLKPAVNSKAESKKAQKQANEDLKSNS